MPLTEQTILSYLWYGYVPPTSFPEWIGRPPTNAAIPKHYDPQTVYSLLCRVFADAMTAIGEDAILAIPLSSGWDSRLLLGMALRHFGTQRIRTVTFGAPGNLDFEIARTIANEVGTEHIELNLLEEPVSWRAMIQTALRYPWTYMPDAWINAVLRSRASDAAQPVHILSGFLGDPLTGGHEPFIGSKDKIIRKFANGQSRLKNARLVPRTFDPVQVLPDVRLSDNVPLSQKLDLGVRQLACIAPIVAGTSRWHRWSSDPWTDPGSFCEVHSPFADPRWVAYWLKAPKQSVRGQRLYLRMIAENFREIYRIPSKNDYTLPRALPFRRSSIKVVKACLRIRRLVDRRYPYLGAKPWRFQNYIDFDNAFRSRSDYRDLAETALEYLLRLSVVPWIDVDKLYDLHMRGSRNLGDELQLLVGLAANIAAEHKETSS